MRSPSARTPSMTRSPRPGSLLGSTWGPPGTCRCKGTRRATAHRLDAPDLAAAAVRHIRPRRPCPGRSTHCATAVTYAASTTAPADRFRQRVGGLRHPPPKSSVKTTSDRVSVPYGVVPAAGHRPCAATSRRPLRQGGFLESVEVLAGVSRMVARSSLAPERTAPISPGHSEAKRH
jgi:hypothetical protein